MAKLCNITTLHFYVTIQTETLMRKKLNFSLRLDCCRFCRLYRARLISSWSGASNYSSHHSQRHGNCLMTMITYYIRCRFGHFGFYIYFPAKKNNKAISSLFTFAWKLYEIKVRIFFNTKEDFLLKRKISRLDCYVERNDIDETWKLSFPISNTLTLNWV